MKKRYYEDWSKSYRKRDALEDFGEYLDNTTKGIYVDINDMNDGLNISSPYDEAFSPMVTIDNMSTARKLIDDCISDCETLDNFYNGYFDYVADSLYDYFRDELVELSDEDLREEASDSNIPYTNREDVIDKFVDDDVDEIRRDYLSTLNELSRALDNYVYNYYDEEKYYDEDLYDRTW